MSIQGIFPIDKWAFKSGSVLTDIPLDELELLTAHQSAQVYRKGELIFREGSIPSGIFFITGGKVKKYKADKYGREQIIYVANTGELLGYHAVLADERYPDSAAALEDSSIAFIPKEDFLSVLQQSEVLNRRLLQALSHEFAVLANSITMFAHKSVRERLALQLIILREKYKVNYEQGMPVEITMSRDDLANLVGAARENIVRLLSAFKAEGLIDTRGRKIIVKDVQGLLDLANYK